MSDPLRLILRNLPFTLTDEYFSSLFSSYDAKAEIARKPNGRSKGFGFITFTSEIEAEKCRTSNPIILENRQITMEFAAIGDKYSKTEKLESKMEENKELKAKKKENIEVNTKLKEESYVEDFLNFQDDFPRGLFYKEVTLEEIPVNKKYKNAVKLYNQTLHRYGLSKDLSTALSSFQKMVRKFMPLTVHSYTCLLNVMVRCFEIDMSEWFVMQMIRHQIEPNIVTYTTLLRGLCSDPYGMRKAKQWFNKIDSPNARTYATMLRGCVRNADVSTAQEMVLSMTNLDIKLEETMAEALCKIYCMNGMIEEARSLIDFMIKSGFYVSGHIYTSLALCCILSRQIGSAKDFIDLARIAVTKPRTNTNFMEENESHLQFEKLTNEETLLEAKRIEVYLSEVSSINESHLKTMSFHQNAKVRFSMHTNDDIKVTAKAVKHLEICSGNGDWIVSQAKKNSNDYWFALEIRPDRCYSIYSKCILENVDNVEVLCGDVGKLLPRIESDSLEFVCINYPEPPGWKESKLRIVSRSILSDIFRVLKSNGNLIILTDDAAYCSEMVQLFQADDIAKLYKSTHGEQLFVNDIPEDYQSGSYFDRMWTNGNRTRRFYMQFEKR